MKTKQVHVVAGVIRNEKQQVLLALRANHAHQGGLWEFSGGKKEPNETVEQALKRELHEELDITVTQARPLIRIHHTYPDKNILLDVWQVERWTGQPKGKEGQLIEWCSILQLAQKHFPAANHPIVNAVQLPAHYLITPEPTDDKAFFYALERSLDQNQIRLVQFRAKQLATKTYCDYAERALDLCTRYQAQLLVNATPELALSVGAHGVHLNATRLHQYTQRPLTSELWVAASCHHQHDLAQAQAIADFAVLSPVKYTQTHPNTKPLGWQQFWHMTESAPLPIFALGGMQPSDTAIAWAHGGQGIAAIRGLWASGGK